MPCYEHVILNTSRWESETIVEWLQYYISIGFDHAYIYCNDDDPAEMYGQLLPYIECEKPFVTFHHIPYQGQQPACWMHFFDNYKDECKWFMFVDADEFLAIKPHNNIKLFMKERENLFDCIHFNWIWFGPENYIDRPRGSTLLQFKHREDERVQMNYFTKTITRSSCVDAQKIGRPPLDMLNHRWPPTVAAALREANVLGEPMTEFMSNFPASAEQFMSNLDRRTQILDTACIYHYLFRSKNDFVRRVERGTLGAYYYQPMWGTLPQKIDEFADFLGRLAARQDLYLHDYWMRRYDEIKLRARATTLVKPNKSTNLARSSRPRQSSISPWSKGDIETDASGAINGIHTGGDGFHTEIEHAPWWMTDLGHDALLNEIRIFNSLKNPYMASRAFPLIVDTSRDGETWERLFENAGNSPFGGADGHPLIIRTDRVARYVKVGITSRDYFHLDEVEIYGTPI